ncbi:DUF4259 domain-containing protein [Streptomyces sp. WM6368]|uniref:DUF4259 domain-containing protein n=1 Tax=Streptomyces sp. WM6368 TaxID=1415554 RepID=UPI003B6417AB
MIRTIEETTDTDTDTDTAADFGGDLDEAAMEERGSMIRCVLERAAVPADYLDAPDASPRPGPVWSCDRLRRGGGCHYRGGDTPPEAVCPTPTTGPARLLERVPRC